MKTIGDLFNCWDTIPQMASEVGVSAWRASKWHQRRRIPDRHWPAVQSALSRKGKKLSADDLLAMHTSRRNRAQQ